MTEKMTALPLRAKWAADRAMSPSAVAVTAGADVMRTPITVLIRTDMIIHGHTLSSETTAGRDRSRTPGAGRPFGTVRPRENLGLTENISVTGTASSGLTFSRPSPWVSNEII